MPEARLQELMAQEVRTYTLLHPYSNRMTRERLSKSIGRPLASGDLFDIGDDDVKMVAVRSHRPIPSQPSSDASRPPSSESEATAMNTSFDADEDDDNDPLLCGVLSKVFLPPASALY